MRGGHGKGFGGYGMGGGRGFGKGGSGGRGEGNGGDFGKGQRNSSYGNGDSGKRHRSGGYGKGGDSFGKGDNSGGYVKGGKGGGKGRGGGGKGVPFWRQFVDPSDDPAIVQYCRETIASFLASGDAQRALENLPHTHRTTLRHMAPAQGVGWVKVSKGVFALVKLAPTTDSASALRALVADVRGCCEASGGKCAASSAAKRLSPALITFLQASLHLKSLKELPSHSAAALEMRAQGVRLNQRGNGFVLEGVEDDDAWHVKFEPSLLAAARAAIDAALRAMPPAARAHHASSHTNHSRSQHQAARFLGGHPTLTSPRELELERATDGYQAMLPQRARLPAFQMGEAICDAVRQHSVTLVLGATGCGKTTQLPQLLYEDCASRGEACLIVASQPRRISATSVALRVAQERGTTIGQLVGFKIRFEDSVSTGSRLLFCTVGILLKTLQTNPSLSGATHIVIDEVHERDLHTDFFLLMAKRLLAARPGLKVVLMSATVDPTAFQAYFAAATSCATVEIPGKTNYPIEELFLEEIIPRLAAQPAHGGGGSWGGGGKGGGSRGGGGRGSSSVSATSAFGVGPLPGLPLVAADVAAGLPAGAAADAETCAALAAAHAQPGESVDLALLVRVVVHIHQTGGDGAVLCFVPGWFEIAEGLKLLSGSECGSELEIFPLHSRMPTAEQQSIFGPPPAGKRKVILSTVLAETSITVEDVVFVVDTGRTKTTFVNEASLVSALRTCFYAKSSGLQRRGRAGRCRPGAWYRLYSSFQWAAMAEYAEPEMQRSPLEELCLEVAALRLGPPADFLAQTLSPPRPARVAHALELLHRIGAVEDEDGGQLTSLGAKLCKLQVHPMLGKMLLIAGVFRCVQPVLSVCAALGYKSPFLCPLGKEAEANAAKRELAQGSNSDHAALVAALDGWQRERHRFASRFFLSSNTLDYISRLRTDLADGARELLHRLPSDHSDPAFLSATLVAGLFPNLAWLRRFGKGETCQGLKVVAHPGSMNARRSDTLVCYYDIQETTERYLYDTTEVQMAPVLLFAQELPVVRKTSTHTTFRLAGWCVAISSAAAAELLALRSSLQTFIQRSVGEPPSELHVAATEALSRVFSEHAPVLPARPLEEEEEEEVVDKKEDDEEEKGGATRVGAGPTRPANPPSTSESPRTAWDDDEEDEELQHEAQPLLPAAWDDEDESPMDAVDQNQGSAP